MWGFGDANTHHARPERIMYSATQTRYIPSWTWAGRSRDAGYHVHLPGDNDKYIHIEVIDHANLAVSQPIGA